MRAMISLYARSLMCLPRLVFGLHFFYLIFPVKVQIEITIQIKTGNDKWTAASISCKTTFSDTETREKTKSLIV